MLRICTNPLRLVDRTLLSIILCGRLRRAAVYIFFTGQSSSLQLLFPTAGSHLTAPSFVCQGSPVSCYTTRAIAERVPHNY